MLSSRMGAPDIHYHGFGPVPWYAIEYYVGEEISLVHVMTEFNTLLTNHHAFISLPGELLPQTINYRNLRSPPVHAYIHADL